ncbi:hypothetical protein [Micromonospora aurantiaca (nom. illeg.)]|uniref:hypothetical protein n=1 Tax=Micromonospora aurantiaca (nom. illeg.) TaxID=47850 RepID=UPI0033FE8664
MAAALRAKGYTGSAETLRRLRTGEHDNPTASTLTGLGEVFGVGAGYFLDPVSVEAQMMTRTIDELSDGAREGLAAIIKSTLEMERAARAAVDSPKRKRGQTTD